MKIIIIYYSFVNQIIVTHLVLEFNVKRHFCCSLKLWNIGRSIICLDLRIKVRLLLLQSRRRRRLLSIELFLTLHIFVCRQNDVSLESRCRLLISRRRSNVLVEIGSSAVTVWKGGDGLENEKEIFCNLNYRVFQNILQIKWIMQYNLNS